MIVSFILPTLNSAEDLECCLRSIREQAYPQDNVEILICDGGSTDTTLDIARQYDCRIVNNPMVLAEPGVTMGIGLSSGDINVMIAADNELAGKDWIAQIVKPFEDPRIWAAYPKIANSTSDTWLSKYYNSFTEPMTHFIYGYASNQRTYHNFYRTLKESDGYTVFDMTVDRHPLLLTAQGFAMRKTFIRSEQAEYDDVLPIIEIIQQGGWLAYVPNAEIHHHTIKNLKHYMKKIRWASSNALNGRNYGLTPRLKYFTPDRKIRMALWIPYALSLIGPLARSFWGLCREGETSWIYHAPMNFFSALTVLTEMLHFYVFQERKTHSRLL